MLRPGRPKHTKKHKKAAGGTQRTELLGHGKPEKTRKNKRERFAVWCSRPAAETNDHRIAQHRLEAFPEGSGIGHQSPPQELLRQRKPKKAEQKTTGNQSTARWERVLQTLQAIPDDCVCAGRLEPRIVAARETKTHKETQQSNGRNSTNGIVAAWETGRNQKKQKGSIWRLVF